MLPILLVWLQRTILQKQGLLQLQYSWSRVRVRLVGTVMVVGASRVGNQRYSFERDVEALLEKLSLW